MTEAIITFVTTETESGVTYPYTKIFRVEFENDKQFEDWLKAAKNFNNEIDVPAQLIVSDSGSYDL